MLFSLSLRNVLSLLEAKPTDEVVPVLSPAEPSFFDVQLFLPEACASLLRLTVSSFCGRIPLLILRIRRGGMPFSSPSNIA